MDLCLYTDSVMHLGFTDALDVAVDIGAKAVEIAAGGQSPAPHMNLSELLDDRSKRDAFAAELATRDLRLAAVNCSAWPMHPQHGVHHERIMRDAIQLASDLGVDKIITMSGCPGDTPDAPTINWIAFPWPNDARVVLEQQWEQATAFWHDMAAYATALGITRIALELHPVHLVYNVPTLLRLRDAIGPVIGANVDPSHMFWQRMDPVAVIGALGPAVHHAHLKDVEFNAEKLALAGVLDSRHMDDVSDRAWIFRTVGRGHPADFWRGFLAALADVGYDDVVSIEHEDPLLPPEDGVREVAALISGLLAETTP